MSKTKSTKAHLTFLVFDNIDSLDITQRGIIPGSMIAAKGMDAATPRVSVRAKPQRVGGAARNKTVGTIKGLPNEKL